MLSEKYLKRSDNFSCVLSPAPIGVGDVNDPEVAFPAWAHRHLVQLAEVGKVVRHKCPPLRSRDAEYFCVIQRNELGALLHGDRVVPSPSQPLGDSPGEHLVKKELQLRSNSRPANQAASACSLSMRLRSIRESISSGNAA